MGLFAAPPLTATSLVAAGTGAFAGALFWADAETVFFPPLINFKAGALTLPEGLAMVFIVAFLALSTGFLVAFNALLPVFVDDFALLTDLFGVLAGIFLDMAVELYPMFKKIARNRPLAAWIGYEFSLG